MPLRTRPLTDEEWASYHVHVAHAFLDRPTPSEAVPLRTLFPGDRLLAVSDPGDGDRLIGGGGIQTRDMTLPGAGPSPVAAVSYVGVRPDGRGRGALTTLMRAQLDELHRAADHRAADHRAADHRAADHRGAEPFAALWASMAPIYGRFGYGLAARGGRFRVPGRAAFRPGSPIGCRVRWLDDPGPSDEVRAVHRAQAANRVGWLTREEPNWRWWLADGDTPFRYLLAVDDQGAPAGYAAVHTHPEWTVRGPEHRVEVKELVAATPEAHVGLWRAMLDLDMVAEVRHWNVALDDPVTALLLKPTAALGDVRDTLWVRLVDVDRALPARRYATPCDLVLEVTDAFCPWNAGRWRLRVDDAGVAEVERSTVDPDLACDVTDLGAAYLGGTRLAALAAAGRVRELRGGAVAAASRAFAGDVEPSCPEVF